MHGIVESYALSPMQEGMLFHFLSGAGNGVDIEQIVCRSDDRLEVDVLREAWQIALARHPALRTSFQWDQVDTSCQHVHESVEVPWDVADWSSLSDADLESSIDQLLREDRRRGFDLARPPLMRFMLRHLRESTSLFVWSFNHIIADGRSFPNVLGEVFDSYDAMLKDEPLELSPVPPFRAHIDHLQRLKTDDAEAFWRKRLDGFTSATPLPRAVNLNEANTFSQHQVQLSAASTAGLIEFAKAHELTVNTLLQAAWALTLARNSGEQDVVFGAIRAGRSSSVPDAESIVGTFINTTPVRVPIDNEASLIDWLQELRQREREVWQYEHTPLVKIQQWSDLPPGKQLFESLIVFDNFALDTRLRARGGAWEKRHFRLHEQTSFPLTLYGYLESELQLALSYDENVFDLETADRLLCEVSALLENMLSADVQFVGQLSTLSREKQRRIVEEWNATRVDYPREVCVHELFEQQVGRRGDEVAVVYEKNQLTYAELNAKANQLAGYLRELGVGPDVLVGVHIERGLDMIVAILAIQKAGGAYVPLDPAFPAKRVALMMNDSRVNIVLTQSHLAAELPVTNATRICIDGDAAEFSEQNTDNLPPVAKPTNLAYVIHTSGSTGQPKGVMVEHRNVTNFFTGMDDQVQPDPDSPGTWLAVTSLSFDISVLELLWTLARGFKVVVYSPWHRPHADVPAKMRSKPLHFSLFYFASADSRPDDKYRLLVEGAKFADAHGFQAVWTPERHFHDFGGLYPNPAVAGAALATITSNLQIRAGSVVMPLHHPVRVAEEWALVDNLSQGRVGVSFASGWQPNDFVIRPDAYDSRHQLMYEGIEIVRRLWRGEAVEFDGVNGQRRAVQTLPRPIQKELPVWVTTAGDIETWRTAGKIGANVLTHLLGQTIDEVAEKIQVYRDAYRAAGHVGTGEVTLMLHTLVGDDTSAVREIVRKPLTDYLRSSVGLIKNAASTWTAYKRKSDGSVVAPPDLSELSDEEMEDLLAYSFDRYFSSSGLFGTREDCLTTIEGLRQAGVDEIACLIDFGVETDKVLAHLPHLAALREAVETRTKTTVSDPVAASGDDTVGALLRRHKVTHLQCTPSMATMFVADEDVSEAMGGLQTLLVGGESFPSSLARELRARTSARIINMYGPTETTVWSSCQLVQGDEEPILIGRPIANTQLYILDETLSPTNIGVVGELYIGGEGVVRGYYERPELTAERFVQNPFVDNSSVRIYRTGDQARFKSDGSVEFLGRSDQQIKFNGHRIELGEIENAMAQHSAVREAMVVAREDAPGEKRLVGYVVGDAGLQIVEDKFRLWLRERLPDYMVPARIVTLEEFPHTPNQKIDRRALPLPETAAVVGVAPSETESTAPPAGEIESQVADIWTEVLGIAAANRDDNFFELGGHSLLAVRVHQRLSESFSRTLAITDLFRFPTIRTLAAYLAESDDKASSSEGRHRGAARREAMMNRARQRQRGKN